MSRVEVTARDYMRSHLRAPRGRGSWAFRLWMPGNAIAAGYWREDLFWHNGLYGEARTAAVAFARSVGAVAVDAQA